jgi:hypothetical protein
MSFNIHVSLPLFRLAVRAQVEGECSDSSGIREVHKEHGEIIESSQVKSRRVVARSCKITVILRVLEWGAGLIQTHVF